MHEPMQPQPLARRGLRPIAELATGRPHGDRLRYMAGCRCDECRRANTQYEQKRAAARKAGQWNGLVSADRARVHLQALRAANVGKRQIADASGVSATAIDEICNGTKLKVRAITEKRLLAVTAAARADGALVDARPTWRRIRQLLKWGYTKALIARELGNVAPALQIRTKQCTARTEHDVERLYERLRCVAASKVNRLLLDLREEGYRVPRIETMLMEVAAERGLPPPDLRARAGWVNAASAALLAELHAQLTEGVPSR
jgi:hypothetical protein